MTVELKPGPFTYRKRPKGWEVAVIVEGNFKQDILCHTEEDARAIADWRDLQHRWAYSHVYDDVCELSRIERTLATMDKYGLNTTFGYGQLQRFADKLRG